MILEPRLPISVCIIASNEAHRIRRALESVAGWTAEIIVVLNDDVNDGTDEIAESFGAKVFREPWKGFVGQKNSVAAKSTQPWLLNLDADEEVTPGLHKEIRSIFKWPSENVAYRFPRCTYFCGRWIRHGDWYPDPVLRLWQQNRAHWEGTEPHAALKVDGPVGRLKADLLHHLSETIDQQIGKISKYSEDFLRDSLTRQRGANGFDMVVRPAWRFARSYFFRLGFLDGWQGVYIAWMTAFYTATRYAKVLVAQKGKATPD